MRILWIILFVLAFLFGEASAQEMGTIAVGHAMYRVTDMLNKRDRTEPWEVYLPRAPRPGYTTPYAVFKGTRGQTTFQETRSDGEWEDETRTEGLDTYLVERYDVHPSQLTPGERSFGHVEERKVDTNEIILSWPIFFNVKEEDDGVYCLTMTSFMPDNRQLLVTRDYKPQEPFAPIKESYKLTEGDTTLLHYVYARLK